MNPRATISIRAEARKITSNGTKLNDLIIIRTRPPNYRECLRRGWHRQRAQTIGRRRRRCEAPSSHLPSPPSFPSSLRLSLPHYIRVTSKDETDRCARGDESLLIGGFSRGKGEDRERGRRGQQRGLELLFPFPSRGSARGTRREEKSNRLPANNPPPPPGLLEAGRGQGLGGDGNAWPIEARRRATPPSSATLSLEGEKILTVAKGGILRSIWGLRRWNTQRRTADCWLARSGERGGRVGRVNTPSSSSSSSSTPASSRTGSLAGYILSPARQPSPIAVILVADIIILGRRAAPARLGHPSGLVFPFVVVVPVFGSSCSSFPPRLALRVSSSKLSGSHRDAGITSSLFSEPGYSCFPGARGEGRGREWCRAATMSAGNGSPLRDTVLRPSVFRDKGIFGEEMDDPCEWIRFGIRWILLVEFCVDVQEI